MRNKTQERVEALARERAVTAIDLGLVEEGIEIGKKIMAEVIAAYPTAGKGAAARRGSGGHGLRSAQGGGKPNASNIADAQSKAQVVPAVGSGYLNEVSSLTVPTQARRQSRALIRRPRSPGRRLRQGYGGQAGEVDSQCRRTASAARTTCRCSSTR